MAIPYLVQRVGKKHKDFNKDGSVDDNYRMEYMGSSEFEFGALPVSLKETCADLDGFNVVQIDAIKDVDDQPLLVLCREVDKEYQEALLTLYVDEHSFQTKESVGLQQMKKPVDDRIYSPAVWWDLDHHVFFCFGETTMNQWQMTLENTRKKFKAAGRI